MNDGLRYMTGGHCESDGEPSTMPAFGPVLRLCALGVTWLPACPLCRSLTEPVCRWPNSIALTRAGLSECGPCLG